MTCPARILIVSLAVAFLVFPLGYMVGWFVCRHTVYGNYKRWHKWGE